ncbi:nitric oxide synthase oxygenase [Allokutzneria sp. A3M-2-11 16]|uniref:nitric oxide synthase oxygenase n=1 Tax=Allokutzneria sp. A3M-2-11 16 TaxID=2962043 RepID=UPI0035A83FCB
MADDTGAHAGTWALPPHLAAPTEAPTGEKVVDADEAEEFLRIFHGENPDAGPVERRVAWVRTEIEMTGSYQHTTAELSFGARVAWRNAARCIGRLYWRSLRVRDMRAVRSATEVAAQCVEHLRLAHNRGRLRPLITIFAPEAPGRPAPRIWNEQLIRYAGYRDGDGRVLGDPRYSDFTGTVTSMGWQPPRERGRFDVLPLVVETPEEGPRLFPLPRTAVDEVRLTHPDHPWFAELGLRWHAVPAISNMRMVIGGVSYPAAPFNGWYMGTEIGARNLADADRYDMLPELAERLGLDTSSETTLWRDRALVELNRAVLHSYAEAGVTITDHHTESQHFLKHIDKEERAGRKCPADWSWIVPPMSGGLTPVFHRYYDTEHLKPEFVADPEAVERGTRGCPAHYADRGPAQTEDQSKPVLWAYLRGPKHAGVSG